MKRLIISSLSLLFLSSFTSYYSPNKISDQTSILFKQTHRVSGFVRDKKTHFAISGVNVVVLGTTMGTYTDEVGIFTFADIPSYKVLRFSYLGYKTQDVVLTTQTQIDVELEPEPEQ